ncbi:MAG: hypothetical protein ACREJU_14235 [Nitrospiraceae bacterium]
MGSVLHNAQPWTFLLTTTQDQAEHARLQSCLTDGNIRWARQAPVLMISVARLNFEHNGKPNRHAFHDVGLVMANLVIQALESGPFVHQMAGILPDKIKALYRFPDSYEPVTGMAFGLSG